MYTRRSSLEKEGVLHRLFELVTSLGRYLIGTELVTSLGKYLRMSPIQRVQTILTNIKHQLKGNAIDQSSLSLSCQMQLE